MCSRTFPLGLNAPNKKLLMTGNDAVARGALEAGVRVVTGHPGGPVTDIVSNLGKMAEELGMSVGWCPNENVAVEEGIGASLAGQRALVVFKDVGLNACFDRIMAVSRAGCEGGLVFVVGDGFKNSPDRQDSRLLTAASELMTLEPTTPQNAKDLTVRAFEFSEQLGLPVFLRMYDGLCGMRTDVTLGEIAALRRTPALNKTLSSKYISCGPVSQERYGILRAKQAEMMEMATQLGMDRLDMVDGEIAVIASGFMYNVVIDTLKLLELKDKISILRINTIHPLPDKLIIKLLERSKKVVIVEDLDPYVERHVKSLAGDMEKRVEILGKLTGDISPNFEVTFNTLKQVFGRLLGLEEAVRPALAVDPSLLVERQPNLCPGCLYYANIHALKLAMNEVSRGRYVAVADGGCFLFTTALPMKPFDALYHLGSSIGVACGLVKAGVQEPVIAFVGDGGLFHSGLQALADVVWNNLKVSILIADNQGEYTTGGQPTIGTGINADGKPRKIIAAEELAKGVGAEFVKVVDAKDLKASVEAIKEAVRFEGPAFVVLRGPCAVEEERRLEERGLCREPVRIDRNTCVYPDCALCLDFGCPSIIRSLKPYVDATCIGCQLCVQVCPHGAMSQAGDEE